MTTATNWFVNFWFALYIPTALNNISWKLYIIFAAICFAAAISTFLFQVETANRSLEEMDVMFDPDKTMWAFMDKDLTAIHPSKRHGERRALTCDWTCDFAQCIDGCQARRDFRRAFRRCIRSFKRKDLAI